MALIDNIVSYYKLDGTSGVVVDSTGNDDAANNGATRGVGGKIGNAFDFEQTNSDFIDGLPTLSAANGTLSFWINKDDASNEFMMGADLGGSNVGDWDFLTDSGILKIFVNDGATKIVQSDGALGTNWVHVVLLWGTGGLIMYINSVAQADTDATTQAPNQTNWYIGGTRIQGYCDALFDEVGYWSRRLTQGEIDELYNSGDGLTYPFSVGTGIQMNIGDAWKAVPLMKINIGDTWKAVEGAQINIGDAWKTLF